MQILRKENIISIRGIGMKKIWELIVYFVNCMATVFLSIIGNGPSSMSFKDAIIGIGGILIILCIIAYISKRR